MDYEESNGRRNGNKSPKTTSRDRTRSLKIRKARRSHDVETGNDHGIVPEKYGRIHVLDHSGTSFVLL